MRTSNFVAEDKRSYCLRFDPDNVPNVSRRVVRLQTELPFGVSCNKKTTFLGLKTFFIVLSVRQHFHICYLYLYY